MIMLQRILSYLKGKDKTVRLSVLEAFLGAIIDEDNILGMNVSIMELIS